MKDFIKVYYDKASEWLNGFKDKEWWKKLILVVISMAVAFLITWGLCKLFSAIVWVLGIVAAVATGILVYCKTKGDEVDGKKE